MKRLAIICLVLNGIISGCACQVPKFNYHFYYADHDKLLGDKPEHDLSYSVCQPEKDNHPCVVMLKSDFKALYQEYLELKK